MGIKLKRKQAKSFRHRMTVGFDRFATPTLLNRMRPECLERQYNCTSTSGSPEMASGANVTVRDGGTELKILQDNIVVGCVDREDVEALRPAVTIGGNILKAVVVDASSLGGMFAIRIAEVQR